MIATIAGRSAAAPAPIEHLPANLAPDVANECRSFLADCEDGLGRARKLRGLRQIFAQRPDTSAPAIKGLARYVHQVDDIERRQLRMDHAIRVLHDNPQLSGDDFLTAVDGTLGAYSQTEAAARLEEGVAERQARTTYAKRPPMPPSTSTNGVSMDLLRKLDADPTMVLVNRAGAVASKRLAHFHAALDSDRTALFSQEHSLYAHLHHAESERHDGRVAAVSLLGVGAGIAAAALPLPGPFKVGAVIGSMVVGLIAAGVTRRVIEKKTDEAVEQKMRGALQPQRQWWNERSGALAPLYAEVRDNTLQRLCNEAQSAPPVDGGHVKVGDGSVDLGGIRVEKRPHT